MQTSQFTFVYPYAFIHSPGICMKHFEKFWFKWINIVS